MTKEQLIKLAEAAQVSVEDPIMLKLLDAFPDENSEPNQAKGHGSPRPIEAPLATF